MKKYFKQISIIAIIIVVLFFILNSKIGFIGKPQAKASPANMSSGPIPVDAMVVKQELLENKLNVTGSLMANEYVDLKAEVAGKITKINFNEGQWVSKGALMLTINDAELKARLEKLKLQKKLAEDNEYRQQVLFEKEAISREEYDVALTELNKAEADIQEIKAQLDKTTILAPFSGIVGLRHVSEGAFVTSNTVIASFFSLDPIKIDFSIPAKYSHLINKNQQITFTVENFDTDYSGNIYAIEPQIDQETRTMKIRAICENNNRELLPGKFVNVTLTLEKIEKAVMIPNISVIPELNTHKIYKYNAGKAKSVEVETGIRSAEMIQITDGVLPGDTVIITGILQIQENAPVQISSLN